MGQTVKRRPLRLMAMHQALPRLARPPELVRPAPGEAALAAAVVRLVAIVAAIVIVVAAVATVTVTATAVEAAVAAVAVAAAGAVADLAAAAVAVAVVVVATAGADVDEGETLPPRRAALAAPPGIHVPRGGDAGGENAIRLKNLL